MKNALFGLIIVGVIALVIYSQVALWNECRAHGHSWFYCFHTLSK